MWPSWCLAWGGKSLESCQEQEWGQRLRCPGDASPAWQREAKGFSLPWLQGSSPLLQQDKAVVVRMELEEGYKEHVGR